MECFAGIGKETSVYSNSIYDLITKLCRIFAEKARISSPKEIKRLRSMCYDSLLLQENERKGKVKLPVLQHNWLFLFFAQSFWVNQTLNCWLGKPRSSMIIRCRNLPIRSGIVRSDWRTLLNIIKSCVTIYWPSY